MTQYHKLDVVHRPVMPRKRCFTIEEISEQTTLSKATIRNMIKDGRIVAKKLGRRVVILAEELDRLLLE